MALLSEMRLKRQKSKLLLEIIVTGASSVVVETTIGDFQRVVLAASGTEFAVNRTVGRFYFCSRLSVNVGNEGVEILVLLDLGNCRGCQWLYGGLTQQGENVGSRIYITLYET